MKALLLTSIFLLLISCAKQKDNKIIFSGEVNNETEFVIFTNDTINIIDGK